MSEQMTETPEITMPHRHTVQFKTSELTLEYEVEPASNGIIFYCSDPKIIDGSVDDAGHIEKAVLAWLQKKFTKVQVDETPKPSWG